ncbi:hypothetical protein C8J56DRAFT_902625 [Mycena floridula]|nr:hypothetical protein C8J56DRAFT_902625 [Mycena floridula]
MGKSMGMNKATFGVEFSERPRPWPRIKDSRSLTTQLDDRYDETGQDDRGSNLGKVALGNLTTALSSSTFCCLYTANTSRPWITFTSKASCRLGLLDMVFTKMQVGISPAARPLANSIEVVEWNRRENDPENLEIVKVKLDETPVLSSPAFTVQAAGSPLGSWTLPFARAGDRVPIATSPTFGVLPPGDIIIPTSAVFRSPTASVSSMHGSQLETSTPHPKTPPAVVGAAVGGGIAVLLALIALAIIIQRHTSPKIRHSLFLDQSWVTPPQIRAGVHALNVCILHE